jgi:calcium uniporter protein, mitochondrial
MPTFAHRSRYLRRRLDLVTSELSKMNCLKRACDREAHAGARRVAISGLAALVVYWGAVACHTFWDYGGDCAY